MLSTASALVSRVSLLIAGAAVFSGAALLPLCVGGCSRGGEASPDAGDLGAADPRRDLAGADLAGAPDLAGSASCPAPCWLNPLPQGNNLLALWRDASGDGWAVGFGPSMVRLQGGSARLVRTLVSENGTYFTGVWGSSQSDVWAVGSGIVHYDGTDWVRSTVDTGGLGLSAVWGSGPKDIWAVGAIGTIRHYDGTAWQVVSSGTTKSLSSVHGTSDKNVFAVGEGGTTLRFDGTAWRTLPLVSGSSLTRVRCAAANDCLAIGELNTVLRWDGAKWAEVKTGLLGNFIGLHALGPGSYLLTGSKVGGSFAYRFDGKTFTEVVTDGVGLSDLAGPSADDLTAVGGAGSIAHWNGLSWTRLGSGSTELLLAMWGRSPTELWLSGAGTGNGGHLLRWDGTTLSSYEAPSSRTVYSALWGSSASSVWAVGTEGNIAHWDGAHWSAVPKVTTGYLSAIHGSGPTHIWAAAGGVLLRFDGTAWSALPSLGSVALLGLWIASASDGWAVGVDSTSKGGLWRFDGSKWTAWPKQFGQSLDAVWGSGPRDVWAGGAQGLLVHFDGTEWTQVKSPSTAAIHTIGGSGPADVWFTGFGGNAYRFDGASWRSVFTDTPLTLNGIWSSGSQAIAIGENGTVLRLSPAF